MDPVRIRNRSYLADYILAENGILQIKLFSFINLALLCIAISAFLAALGWTASMRELNVSQSFTSFAGVSLTFGLIISTLYSYSVSAFRGKRLSIKSIDEISKIKSAYLVRWTGIRKVSNVDRTFSIWTSRKKFTLRVKRSQFTAVDRLFHEKIKLTWTRMERRRIALVACYVFPAVGFVCAFLPPIYWVLQTPGGSVVILYPSLIAGYLSLLISIVMAVFYYARPRIKVNGRSDSYHQGESFGGRS